MSRTKKTTQRQSKKSEVTPKAEKSSQQKTEASPLPSLDLSAQVTPNDMLSMQQSIGNQATLQILQRYQANLLQRDPNKPKSKDETPDSIIVFTEDEVPPIVVPNPWTTATLQADPTLKTKDQGMKTIVKSGKGFAKKSDPLNYTYRFNDDTVVNKTGKGVLPYHLIKKNAIIKDASGGMPKKWEKPFIKLGKNFEFATGVESVRLRWWQLFTKYYKFAADSKRYLAKPESVHSRLKPYVVIKIGSAEYHANKEDLYESQAKHKKTDDPLFPDGKALPEHVKQTGLGDCYLQAFLINAAVQNPGHLKNMMFDNGDGSVTVRYYFKSGNKWSPDFVRIQKSIAFGATGKELYNEGALWAHIIEKSFTVFAGKHGMYGKALSPPSQKGYGAIEGGWTYQLGGVFYGAASKVATLQNMSFDTDSAKMIKDNYAQIKQLFELKSSKKNPYLDKKQAVMLTASSSWYDTLKRMIAVAKSLEGSTNATSNLGKGIKDMREKLEEAKTATDKPENSNKGKMDIAEVVTAVKKSKDYSVGDGVIGKEARSNPDKSLLNRFYELLNNFKELGSDSSPNQRFIYTHHAYSVVDTVFKDSKGDEYWPGRSDLDNKKSDVVKNIDPKNSTVTLRNPHRTNTPTQNATEEAPGKFTISLEQFLFSFTRMEYGKVEKT